MIVGILKEIKVLEKRVCMTPAGVVAITQNGHEVLVEKDAGAGAGFPDSDYVAAGARIAGTRGTGLQRIRYGHARERTPAV